MEPLTEDGDVVLAGRKENQKSLRLKRAQCLLVKADNHDFTPPQDIQVTAQSLTAKWLSHCQN